MTSRLARDRAGLYFVGAWSPDGSLDSLEPHGSGGVVHQGGTLCLEHQAGAVDVCELPGFSAVLSGMVGNTNELRERLRTTVSSGAALVVEAKRKWGNAVWSFLEGEI
jgi:hypothetical protein